MDSIAIPIKNPRCTRRWRAGAFVTVPLAAVLALSSATPATRAAEDALLEPPKKLTHPHIAGLPLDEYSGNLPLGSPALEEMRTSEVVAEGVTYTRILRGNPSGNVFTLDMLRTTDGALARDLAKRLEADGYRPLLDAVPAPMDADRDVQMWLVRVGSASTGAELNPLRSALQADGYPIVGTVPLPPTGGYTTGPWDVHVLHVEADVLREGRVKAVLARNEVRGLATVPTMADANDAMAAVNAGFFITSTGQGTLGQLAGISMIGGNLVSEAVNGRTSLILPAGDTPLVSALFTELTVMSWETEAERHIDGVNRRPGAIRSCGGVGSDTPTTDPRHDFTCTDDHELIHFNPIFGATTESGSGAEAVLDENFIVTEFRTTRGGAIPASGSVLSATGNAVGWLRANATVGAQLDIKYTIHSADAALPDREGMFIVNGGPRLVRNGQIDIPSLAEGFDWPDNPNFYYSWVFGRHPRTFAGVTADGDLYLVVIDGRQAHSVGATLWENARVLQSFGVREGVNLDGGGSSIMMVGDRVVNLPSERPYRPMADALVITH